MTKETIDPSARIADGAHIADTTFIGAECEIGPQAHIGVQNILGQRVRLIGDVVIKNSVQIADDVVLVGPLVIENGCHIAQWARIGTGQVSQTRIRQFTQIGRGAVIESGVELGENVFIKANCRVSMNIPSHALVGGDPPILIEYLCGCSGQLISHFGNGLLATFRCRRCKNLVTLTSSDINRAGHVLLPEGKLGPMIGRDAWWLRWNPLADM